MIYQLFSSCDRTSPTLPLPSPMVMQLQLAHAGPDPRFLDDDGAPRPPSLREIQEFVWNRLRGVARDFTSQNYRATGRNDAWVQEAHERMVRVY